MIHYNSNNPEHMEARKNVKPLSVEELSLLVQNMSSGIILEEDEKAVQRLIYHYENLQHFYDVVGGWNGYLKAKYEGMTEKEKKEYELFKTITDTAENIFEHFSEDDAKMKKIWEKNGVESQLKEAFSYEPEGWISVNDRLPEENTKLLLFIKNDLRPHWSGESPGSFQNDKFYVRGGIDTSCEKVTHWVPLPEPPKK